MQLAVTIRSSRQDELVELRELISAIRRAFSSESVTVLEAPEGFDYPYPLPMVTITDDSAQRRLYGSEAVEKLRDLAHAR